MFDDRHFQFSPFAFGPPVVAADAIPRARWDRLELPAPAAPLAPFIHQLNGDSGFYIGRPVKCSGFAEKMRIAPGATTDQTEKAEGRRTQVRQEFVDCPCKVAQLTGKRSSVHFA